MAAAVSDAATEAKLREIREKQDVIDEKITRAEKRRDGRNADLKATKIVRETAAVSTRVDQNRAYLEEAHADLAERLDAVRGDIAAAPGRQDSSKELTALGGRVDELVAASAAQEQLLLRVLEGQRKAKRPPPPVSVPDEDARSRLKKLQSAVSRLERRKPPRPARAAPRNWALEKAGLAAARLSNFMFSRARFALADSYGKTRWLLAAPADAEGRAALRPAKRRADPNYFCYFALEPLDADGVFRIRVIGDGDDDA